MPQFLLKTKPYERITAITWDSPPPHSRYFSIFQPFSKLIYFKEKLYFNKIQKLKLYQTYFIYYYLFTYFRVEHYLLDVAVPFPDTLSQHTEHTAFAYIPFNSIVYFICFPHNIYMESKTQICGYVYLTKAFD